MTTFDKCVRIFTFPIITGIVFACASKKDNPDPVTPIEQYKDVHVNVILNINMDRANSNFLGTAFYNEDKSIGHGLDVFANSTDKSKVSTTTWSADGPNTPFTVSVHTDNITYGNQSVKGGEYYVAAINDSNPIITYNSVEKSDFKVAQEINTAQKINLFKHIKKVNLYAPLAMNGGIRIMGSQHVDNEAFLKYIANCADTQSVNGFASRRYLSIETSQNSSFTVIP